MRLNRFVLVGFCVFSIGFPFSRPAKSQDATAPHFAFLTETIHLADGIAEEKTRSAAQWQMVYALVRAGKPNDALDQALKLSNVNPHTCILALTFIGEDAVKRRDKTLAEKAFQAATEANRNNGSKHTHYVVDMGFKTDRPLELIMKTAAPNKLDNRSLGSIRDWLARKGRVDEAYALARKHMPKIKMLHHHQRIGYACASVKGYDYDAKHDYFGQSIDVINKMPEGKERDGVIVALVKNLTYTVNNEKVSQEHLQLAKHWASQLKDDAQRGEAERKVLQRESVETVDQLEKRFAAAELREKKSELLKRIFQQLIEAGDVESADRILPRQLQLIKEQPRAEQISAFGVFNDKKATKYTTWLHEQAMVRGLIKADKLQEAKKRLDAMADIPDDEQPILFVGNLASIRQTLMLELGEFDDLKRLLDEKHPGQPHVYHQVITQHLVKQGKLKQATNEFANVLSQQQEVVFDPKRINHFSATVHQELSDALVKSGDVDAAVKVLSQIPEHEYLTEPFKSFGRTICADGTLQTLEPWLEKLPHQTAQVHARLAAWQTATKKK